MCTQTTLEDLCLKLGKTTYHETCCKTFSTNSALFFGPIPENKNAKCLVSKYQ